MQRSSFNKPGFCLSRKIRVYTNLNVRENLESYNKDPGKIPRYAGNFGQSGKDAAGSSLNFCL
jgi:hypothetical protein